MTALYKNRIATNRTSRSDGGYHFQCHKAIDWNAVIIILENIFLIDKSNFHRQMIQNQICLVY